MVEALRPEDAPELIRLAAQWQSGPIVISPGAHGAVVRERGHVVAWVLLRELPYGFCVDEIWGSRDVSGKRALAELAQWTEQTVARIAADRGLESISLGGMCRLDNVPHYRALERRGYRVVAHVFAKEIRAAKAVAV